MCELVCGMCSDWAISIRTACAAIGHDRSTIHYESSRADQAAVGTRVSHRYRRGHVLLYREGRGININTVYRFYMELGMQLRTKTPKRRVKAEPCDDRAEVVGRNDV